MTTRCVDGVIYRHRPFPDDPDYEHDVGACPHLDADGCARCEEPVTLDDLDETPLPLSAYGDRAHG